MIFKYFAVFASSCLLLNISEAETLTTIPTTRTTTLPEPTTTSTPNTIPISTTFPAKTTTSVSTDSTVASEQNMTTLGTLSTTKALTTISTTRTTTLPEPTTTTTPHTILISTTFPAKTTTSVSTGNCSTGYRRVNGTCQDINECYENREICSDMCLNIPGGFVCHCHPGLVKRTIEVTWEGGNDNMEEFDIGSNKEVTTCLCFALVSQRFGIPYSDAYLDKSSVEYKNISSMLNLKIMESIKRSSYGYLIVGLNVVRITKGSIILTYEMLGTEPLYMAAVQTIYNESIASNFWNSSTGLPGVTVEAPQLASPMCIKDKIPSRTVVNRTYSFPTADINTVQRSRETCSNSGFYATIKCVLLTSEDYGPQGLYAWETLTEHSCKENASQIVDKMTNYTSTSVESAIEDISAISSDSSSEGMKSIISSLDILQNAVVTNDVDITKDTLVYLSWLADDIYDVVQTESAQGKTTFSRQDQVDFIKSLETFSSNLMTEDDVFSVSSESHLFVAHKIQCSTNSTSAVTFDETMMDPTSTFHPRVHAFIPASALPTSCNKSSHAVFYLHKTNTLFPSPSNSKTKINQVFSSQITRTKLSKLSEPITHQFGQPTRGEDEKRNFVTHRCSYLDLTTGYWKYDGCRTSVVDSKTTSCDCDHTTNFAVLVQTHVVASSFAINIVGYVGCSCSVAGLVIMLIIYLSFEKLRTNQINQLHIHLGICLLIAYLTFLIGVERPRPYVPCMIVGGVLQLTFLSAWGWMFAECVTMYRKFVRIFSHMSTNYVMKTSFIVYTLSIFATGVTVILAYVTGDMMEYEGWSTAADNDPLFHPSYYVSDRLCWLHGYPLYFGFLTPVGLMFLANIFGFIRVIRVLTNTKSELRSTKVLKNENKEHAYRILTVSVLLGITWLFAIPLTITDDVIVNEVFGWLFSIANAFQGLFIFLLFCVKRKDVRTMWTKPLFLLRRSSSSSYNVHTATAATTSTGVTSPSQTDTHEINQSTIFTYKNLENANGKATSEIKVESAHDADGKGHIEDDQQSGNILESSSMTEIHLSPIKNNT